MCADDASQKQDLIFDNLSILNPTDDFLAD